MSAQFDAEEQRAILAQVHAGEPPTCPRDAAPMTTRSIGGGAVRLGGGPRRGRGLPPPCTARANFARQEGARGGEATDARPRARPAVPLHVPHHPAASR